MWNFLRLKGETSTLSSFLEPPCKELSSFFESPDFLHRTINLGEKPNYRTPPLNASGNSCITAKSALLYSAWGHPGMQGDVGAVPSSSCRSTESPGCPIPIRTHLVHAGVAASLSVLWSVIPQEAHHQLPCNSRIKTSQASAFSECFPHSFLASSCCSIPFIPTALTERQLWLINISCWTRCPFVTARSCMESVMLLFHYTFASFYSGYNIPKKTGTKNSPKIQKSNVFTCKKNPFSTQAGKDAHPKVGTCSIDSQVQGRIAAALTQLQRAPPHLNLCLLQIIFWVSFAPF